MPASECSTFVGDWAMTSSAVSSWISTAGRRRCGRPLGRVVEPLLEARILELGGEEMSSGFGPAASPSRRRGLRLLRRSAGPPSSVRALDFAGGWTSGLERVSGGMAFSWTFSWTFSSGASGVNEYEDIANQTAVATEPLIELYNQQLRYHARMVGSGETS